MRSKSSHIASHSLSPREQLRTRVIQFIEKLSAGDRLPGVHVLADQMKTSPVTLRLILQQLVESGTLESRPRSGTYVSPQAGARPVALMTTHELFHPQASRYELFLIGDLRQRLTAMGRLTQLFVGQQRPWELPPEGSQSPHENAPSDFLSQMKAGRFSAAFVLSPGNLETWLPQAQAMGIPIIGSDRRLPSQVIVSHQDAVRFSVRRLVERGHRKLALLGWNQSAPGFGSRSSNAAFADEMQRHGLRVEPAWMTGDFHPTRLFRGADALREVWSARREKFDGLIIADDVLARTALPAIANLGASVAKRLAVVSHCNQDDPLTAPFPISWFRVERGLVANAMVQMLSEAVPMAGATRKKDVPVAWVERSSHSQAVADGWISADGFAQHQSFPGNVLSDASDSPSIQRVQL